MVESNSVSLTFLATATYPHTAVDKATTFYLFEI